MQSFRSGLLYLFDKVSPHCSAQNVALHSVFFFFLVDRNRGSKALKQTYLSPNWNVLSTYQFCILGKINFSNSVSLKFFTGKVAILMPTFGRCFEGYDKLSIDKHHIQHIINAGEMVTQHTYFLFSLAFFGCISPLTLTFKNVSSFFSLPLPLLLLLSYFLSHKQTNLFKNLIFLCLYYFI